jgi:3-oxoacyl-[acyl-carrier-protein] synthase II
VSREVFVAGRGAVTCFGAGRQALCTAVFEGRSGVQPRARLADVDCLTDVAAELPPEIVAGAEREGLPLPLVVATAAAREALAEAEEVEGPLGLVLASTKADLSGIVGPGDGLGRPGYTLEQLGERLAVEGPRAAISCACASGLIAIAQAGRWIRAGAAEDVLVVGVDVLNDFILRGFSSLLALSKEPSRPFDRSRTGLSLGEGAGALLLSARRRRDDDVRLAGWGSSNDANHVTGPSRDGSGLALAMQRALRSADCAVDDVDYIHLHGTGTPYNDAMECRALESVFAKPPIASGSKAQIGHTLGAAGVLESVIAVEALTLSEAPPNARLKEVDEGVRVPLEGSARELPRARVAMKVSAGFGGINAAAVLRA